MVRRVLIVDEDAQQREDLTRWLHRDGFDVLLAESTEQAERALTGEVCAVVCAYHLRARDGVHLKESHQGIPFIFTIAGDRSQDEQEALEAGVFEILRWPIHPRRLVHLLRHAAQLTEMSSLVHQVRSQLGERFGFRSLVGTSRPMRNLVDRIRHVADTQATILIEGESGTETERIARILHQNNARHLGPFVPFHCEALPPGIGELELFGQEAGDRPGHPGKIRQARSGTLFLEEVDALPRNFQAGLLRLLETRRYCPVGSSKEVVADVRIIATTSKDLSELVQQGSFSRDLHFALSGILLRIPPLRERREDLCGLVQLLMTEIARENERPEPEITRGALGYLQAFEWPGNVRQLRSCLEQMILMGRNIVLDVPDLPEPILRPQKPVQGPRSLAGMTMAEIERVAIYQTLEKTGGNRRLTAQLLGIGLRTLHRKLGQYDLR